MFDFNLIKVRLLSFGYSVAALFVSAIIGVIISPEFSAAVHQNFGDGALVALGLATVVEFVKHFRNVAVVSSAADELGSLEAGRRSVTLI